MTDLREMGLVGGVVVVDDEDSLAAVGDVNCTSVEPSPSLLMTSEAIGTKPTSSAAASIFSKP